MDEDDLKEDEKQYAAYKKAKANFEAHKISDSALRGRNLFFSEKANCTACHVGANLSDEQYHNLGVGMTAEKPDLGRFEISKEEKDTGAFKTPTIRNVEYSAPYMHDGSQKTLEEVVEWYAKGGHPNPHLDPKIKKLDADTRRQGRPGRLHEGLFESVSESRTEELPQSLNNCFAATSLNNFHHDQQKGASQDR